MVEPANFWEVDVVEPLTAEMIDALRAEASIDFFGLTRPEESTVGHRILRVEGDDVAAIFVRRWPEKSGFSIEMVSSINDDDRTRYEFEHRHVLDIMRRLGTRSSIERDLGLQVESFYQAHRAESSLGLGFPLDAAEPLAVFVAGEAVIRERGRAMLARLGQGYAQELADADARKTWAPVDAGYDSRREGDNRKIPSIVQFANSSPTFSAGLLWLLGVATFAFALWSVLQTRYASGLPVILTLCCVVAWILALSFDRYRDSSLSKRRLLKDEMSVELAGARRLSVIQKFVAEAEEIMAEVREEQNSYAGRAFSSGVVPPGYRWEDEGDIPHPSWLKSAYEELASHSPQGSMLSAAGHPLVGQQSYSPSDLDET